MSHFAAVLGSTGSDIADMPATSVRAAQSLGTVQNSTAPSITRDIQAIPEYRKLTGYSIARKEYQLPDISMHRDRKEYVPANNREQITHQQRPVMTTPSGRFYLHSQELVASDATVQLEKNWMSLVIEGAVEF